MADFFYLVRNIVGNMRNMLALGVISNVDDSGAAQTADLATGTGVNRAKAEVAQAFGFGSVPPTDGAIGVVIELGADPANLIVLPLANASARFAGLLPGEAVMYGADGTRVRIRQGSVLEIWAAHVKILSTDCVIDAPNGCTINGNVTVNGSFTATGDVSDSHGSLNRLRGNYDAHTHPSGSTTSNPDPE